MHDYDYDDRRPSESELREDDRDRRERENRERALRDRGVFVPDVWDHDDIRAVEAAFPGCRVKMTRAHVLRVGTTASEAPASLDPTKYEFVAIDGQGWVRVRADYLASPTHPSVPPF